MSRLLPGLLLLIACRSAPQAPALLRAQPIRLTLAATGDWHGWVAPQVEAVGGAQLRVGGAAAYASTVRALRQANPGGVLVLDSGDLFQGTLLSNLTEGSAVVDAFNGIGFDAVAIGNHEFDYGPVGPVSAAQPGMDPFGALKARIAQAKFPLLSTNIYEADTGLRPGWLPGDGTVLLERNGVKVGVIGLTTPQTPTTTLPINVASLRFGQLAPEAMLASNRLRARGADVVIAVVHAGGRCSDVEHPRDSSSCDLDSGEIFLMLKALPEGTLDAVVAGHTHQRLNHFVKGVPVIESWALGRYFGTIDLLLDPVTHQVLKEQTAIRAAQPICETMDEATGTCDLRVLKAAARVTPVPARFEGQPLVPDPAVAAALAPAEQRVFELQHRKLGLTAPATLGRDYENESPLGNLLADSLRALERADVALLNPGGLRADLRAGELTYGSVYEVIPFDNAIATLQVTGEELTALLRAAYGSRKGVFQVSGLEVKLSQCPGGERLKSVALEGGKVLDAKARYRVVLPDFLARGGDGLGPMLARLEPRFVDLGSDRELNIRDALVEYLQKKKQPLIAPRSGRIRFLPEAGPCPPN